MNKKYMAGNISFYEHLVEPLDENARCFLVDALWKHFQYNYLKPENIRNADIIEFLCKKEDECCKEFEIIGSAADFYGFLLDAYLDECASCKAGTSLKQYKEKALSKLGICNGKLKKGVTYADCDDALIVFLAIFRVIYKDGYKNYVATKTVFETKKEDSEALLFILKYPYVFPDKVKRELKRMNKKFDAFYEKRKIVEYFVFVSMIIMTRILQDCGEFEE